MHKNVSILSKLTLHFFSPISLSAFIRKKKVYLFYMYNCMSACNHVHKVPSALGGQNRTLDFIK